MLHVIKETLNNFGDAVWGMAYGRMRSDIRGQAVELNDLFLLLCYMESVGLPNPTMAYLLEVYPFLMDEFHLWHRRMGADRSPLASFSCC